MPEIPFRGVTGDDVTDEHLWKHGLRFDDAIAVWQGPAKYFDQPESIETDELGRFRRRPPRTLMIGPDEGLRWLTFILELPNRDEESHVVTGWPSTLGEQSRYHQPGGRMRPR